MDPLDNKEEDNQEQPVKRPSNWPPLIFCIILIIVFMKFLGIGIGIKSSKTENTKVEQSSSLTPTQTAKQEEERKIDLAKQYCVERLKDGRYYPIPEIKIGANGKKEYELNDKFRKTGPNLTQTDCKNIIDYLTDLSIKYATVLSINIEAVVKRQLWIGMSGFEVWSSLGYPNNINTTNYGLGENQQYVYYKDSYGASAYYIYLEKGKVTSYQDF